MECHVNKLSQNLYERGKIISTLNFFQLEIFYFKFGMGRFFLNWLVYISVVWILVFFQYQVGWFLQNFEI